MPKSVEAEYQPLQVVAMPLKVSQVEGYSLNDTEFSCMQDQDQEPQGLQRAALHPARGLWHKGPACAPACRLHQRHALSP